MFKRVLYIYKATYKTIQMFDNDYFFNLINSDNYEKLREVSNKYLIESDFYSKYNIFLSLCIIYQELPPLTTEKDFLWFLIIELQNQQKDIIKNGNKTSSITSNGMKTMFILTKLEKLLLLTKNEKELRSLKQIKQTDFKSSKLTICGKQINLKERYLIANEVLGIDTKIRTLKISESEKHNLLSLILGCNIDNAKKIMNNNYDTKVKETLLAGYYKSLNL